MLVTCFYCFFFLVLLLAAFFAAMWSVFPEEMIPEHNLFGLVITVLFCLIAETLIVKIPMPKGFPPIPPLLGEGLLIIFKKSFTTSKLHYILLESWYLFLKREQVVQIAIMVWEIHEWQILPGLRNKYLTLGSFDLVAYLLVNILL